ncbi:MAG: hypothetical protein HC881_21545 [Leptolyngbyaceae cyanobacterium SL_7_1]|nr:hypothetical protein [Leptolyngbyaceae cyanobacterium SL_7_1]
MEFTATNTINEPTITRDVFFGPESALATALTNINNVLYFSARDNSGSFALWRSLGALNNTVPIRNFNSPPDDILALDGANGVGTGDVFFLADGGLWTTTGAPGNATQITTVDLSTGGTGNLSTVGTIEELTAIGDSLYFTNDVAGQTGFYRLKKTGTTFTLTEVIAPSISSIDNLTRVGSSLYYTRLETASGQELYRIKDASNSTTSEIFDLRPGNGTSINTGSTFVAAGNNTLYFTANAVGAVGVSNELYRIRETETTPTLITFAEDEPLPRTLTYVPDADALFLVADANADAEIESELFKIADAADTTATTATLLDINTNPDVGAFNGINNPLIVGVGTGLFFTASNATSNDAPTEQLFALEASGTGTGLPPLTLTSFGGGATFGELVAVGNKAAFTIEGATSGTFSLWSSDGSAAGTTTVLGSENVLDPTQLTAVGSRLFFVGEDAATDPVTGTGRGSELWVIDP